MPKKTDVVIAKTEQNKELLIEQIRKTPIIQVACEKTGVGRATYYRWRKEDETFYEKSDEALAEGINLINDLAESQLISAIKDKHMTAIIFWLKNRHKDYKTRVEVSTTKDDDGKLTPEQEELLTIALKRGHLLQNDSKKEGGDTHE